MCRFTLACYEFCGDSIATKSDFFGTLPDPVGQTFSSLLQTSAAVRTVPRMLLKQYGEAEALVEISGERWWCAGLHPLRGGFLTAIVAPETPIEAAFHEAITTAKRQKSYSQSNADLPENIPDLTLLLNINGNEDLFDFRLQFYCKEHAF